MTGLPIRGEASRRGGPACPPILAQRADLTTRDGIEAPAASPPPSLFWGEGWEGGPSRPRHSRSFIRRTGLASVAAAALALALAGCVPAVIPTVPADPLPATLTQVLDDFEGGVEGWSAHPSEGVELRISRDSGFSGKAMRLDFDFHGGAGYAIARKAIPLYLPPNYELAFRIRADAPVNDLELKLIDPSGDNVWWTNRRRFEFPREWTRLRTRKRQIEFAWGPKGGGDLDRLAQLEIVVTAGTGGKGTVWIDDLTFREREVDGAYTHTPVVTATASPEAARLAMDGDPATAWHSGGSGVEVLDIDFGKERELGGVAIDWDSPDHAAGFQVLASENGIAWEELASVRSNGGRDVVYLPDTDTRWLRLKMQRSSRERGYGIREIEVEPAEWSRTPNAFFANLAKEAPRGAYPRAFTGEQSYWTVVGVNGDTRESAVSQDGMVETGIGGPSLEPFLYADGRLTTWADVTASQSLEKGYLPIPSVTWDARPLRLTVTAIPAGEREASTVYARYVVENRSAMAKDVTLFLALRPFQVNPPWQFLNIQGGVARVREVSAAGGDLSVGGRSVVIPITSPHAFGATAFAGGDVVSFLRRGEVPKELRAADANGFASAALAYPMTIPAGGSSTVLVAIPLHPASPAPAMMRSEGGAEMAARLLGQAVTRWERELDRFTLRLPAAMHGQEIAATLKAQLAYILINRDGPSIQPGSRSYDRSWIRDGSLTSAALLRLGHPAEVREFAEWYAPHQRASGYVPCCVSLRGADPVPEHDSHGQLVYLIAEYHRQTRDREFLARMYPHVERAVAYIDTLRHERMTPEYRTGEMRAFYGMLPQSISHEGYSARPMHSYWDAFFALKGLDDAVYAADVLGRGADRARFAAIRDEFRRDLLASLAATMASHRIEYLPGSVELGDFDATSTTVGVNPMGGLDFLPRRPLEATFERYYRQSVRARLDGAEWEAYTPYEWRTVGTFVRLGWKARAHESIGLFFSHQRPPGWRHWAEVVFRDPGAPRFIGDMPHTWVGSDFIRSVLDLFAYERASDNALVVGAGVPAAWVEDAPGVEMDGLRTYFGTLSLRMRAEAGTVRVRIGGGLAVPPGGIVVRSPLERPIRRATVNGRAVRVASPDEVVVRQAPAEIVLYY
jgi:hypothetical protein